MAETAIAPQDPEPNNVHQLYYGSSAGQVTVYPNSWQQSQNYWYPYYVQVPAKGDEERLRFALELIAEGGLTHEVVKQIAKRALKQD